MLRWITGAFFALSIAASSGGAIRAETQATLYDAPAIVGAGQAESLHGLAAGRLAQLRALQPEGADLPAIEGAGPKNRSLSGDTLSDMVARVQDLPFFAVGYHDLGLWSHGFGRKAGFGDSEGAFGFSSTIAGSSIGIDRPIGEHWVVGAMAGASAGDIAWNGERATGAAVGGAVAFYAGYFDRDVFLDLSLSVGWTRSDSDLSTESGFDRNDITIGGRIDGGFDLEWAGLRIRPVASASLISVNALDGSLPPAGLGGGEPVAFAATEPATGRMHQVRLLAGVQMSRSFAIGDMTLEATGSLTWRRNFTFDAASPPPARDGAIEPIRNIRIDRGSLEPQLGLSLKLEDGWDLFTRYDGHFSADWENHRVTGGLRGRF